MSGECTNGIDRSSLSLQEFNELLTFEGGGRGAGTVDLIIRDDNDLLILATRRKNEESRWSVRSYKVVGDGVSFATEDLDRADVAAILIEQFDPDDLTTDERYSTGRVQHGVPVAVAVDGKPAICAWLYASHELARETIADRMDVGKPTVREYLSRFRRRGTGVPDDLNVPDVGEFVPEIPPKFDPACQQIVADGEQSVDTDRGSEGGEEA